MGLAARLIEPDVRRRFRHMIACFPKGRQILDYYHCAEHIHKVGVNKLVMLPHQMEQRSRQGCRIRTLVSSL